MKLKFILFTVILLFIVLSIDMTYAGFGDNYGYNNLEVPQIPAEINYSKLPTVNSSDYWDNLDTPSDILTSTLNNDAFLDLAQSVWYNDSQGVTYWDGDSLETNVSYFETTFYNATSYDVVAGTDVGTLSDILAYNGNSLNITEVASNPGLDLRVNFTGITAFNQIIWRYKSSAGENHQIEIQLYNFVNSNWEDYAVSSEVSNFITKSIGVFDYSEHIGTGANDGEVWIRFVSNSIGNPNHKHYFDWVTITNGFAIPSGAEIDPYWTADKPNYWLSNGSSTATGNWNLNGYGIWNISYLNGSLGAWNITNNGDIYGREAYLNNLTLTFPSSIQLKFREITGYLGIMFLEIYADGGATASFYSALNVRGDEDNNDSEFYQSTSNFQDFVNYHYDGDLDKLQFKSATGGYEFDNDVDVDGSLNANQIISNRTDIYQSADLKGLIIKGYDDRGDKTINISIRSDGNSQFTGTGIMYYYIDGVNVDFGTQFGHGWADGKILYIGSSSNDNGRLYSSTAQTWDAPMILANDDATNGARTWIFADAGDRDYNFQLPKMTHPTLAIMSENQATNQYMLLYSTSAGSEINVSQDRLSITNGSGYADIYVKSLVENSVVYDKSEGSALDKIKDVSEYTKEDGSVDHTKHYAYTPSPIPDYDRPVEVEVCEPDPLSKSGEHCYIDVSYPYTKQGDFMSTSLRVATTEQAISELKQENQLLKDELCSKDNTYSFC